MESLLLFGKENIQKSFLHILQKRFLKCRFSNTPLIFAMALTHTRTIRIFDKLFCKFIYWSNHLPIENHTKNQKNNSKTCDQKHFNLLLKEKVATKFPQDFQQHLFQKDNQELYKQRLSNRSKELSQAFDCLHRTKYSPDLFICQPKNKKDLRNFPRSFVRNLSRSYLNSRIDL